MSLTAKRFRTLGVLAAMLIMLEIVWGESPSGCDVHRQETAVVNQEGRNR